MKQHAISGLLLAALLAWALPAAASFTIYLGAPARAQAPLVRGQSGDLHWTIRALEPRARAHGSGPKAGWYFALCPALELRLVNKGAQALRIEQLRLSGAENVGPDDLSPQPTVALAPGASHALEIWPEDETHPIAFSFTATLRSGSAAHALRGALNLRAVYATPPDGRSPIQHRSLDQALATATSGIRGPQGPDVAAYRAELAAQAHDDQARERERLAIRRSEQQSEALSAQEEHQARIGRAQAEHERERARRAEQERQRQEFERALAANVAAAQAKADSERKAQLAEQERKRIEYEATLQARVQAQVRWQTQPQPAPPSPSPQPPKPARQIVRMPSHPMRIEVGLPAAPTLKPKPQPAPPLNTGNFASAEIIIPAPMDRCPRGRGIYCDGARRFDRPPSPQPSTAGNGSGTTGRGGSSGGRSSPGGGSSSGSNTGGSGHGGGGSNTGGGANSGWTGYGGGSANTGGSGYGGGSANTGGSGYGGGGSNTGGYGGSSTGTPSFGDVPSSPQAVVGESPCRRKCTEDHESCVRSCSSNEFSCVAPCYGKRDSCTSECERKAREGVEAQTVDPI